MLYFSIASLFPLFFLAEKRPQRVLDAAKGEISASRP
jgi:hypothetical protein